MNGYIQLVLRFWKLKADKVKMYFPQEQFTALLLNDKITIITPCLLIINIICFMKNNKLIGWNGFTFLYSH